MRVCVAIMYLGLNVMPRILRGLFCLCFAVVLWLGCVAALGLMSLCDWFCGWVNCKFEELFKDF